VEERFPEEEPQEEEEEEPQQEVELDYELFIPPEDHFAAADSSDADDNIQIAGATLSLEDAAPSHRALLTHSLATGTPVSVKLDPTKTRIVDVSYPLRASVSKVTEQADGCQVSLFPSAASHFVKKTNSNYAKLVDQLKAAVEKGKQEAFFITEDIDRNIVQVAPAPVLPKATLPNGGRPLRAAGPAKPVSLAQAKDLFNQVNALTCDPLNPKSTCIPFKYPDDGCWGRAHEMCRLFAKRGITGGKVWNYGNLRADTPNNPNCQVQWGYHVAPILNVTQPDGTAKPYVIDPAMFNQPVPVATWADAQHDSEAQSEFSDCWVYFTGHFGGVETDTDYTDTQDVLRTYRARLLQRAKADGPPPYSSCS